MSLTAAQLAVFLAQLSGRADVSDASLKRLTGTPDETRRKSLMPALTSSDERTELFATRMDLIVAFLEHNPGESGHGAASAAAPIAYPSHDQGGRRAGPQDRLGRPSGTGWPRAAVPRPY